MPTARKLIASSALTLAVFVAVPVLAQDIEVTGEGAGVDVQVDLPAPPPELFLGPDFLALTLSDDVPVAAPAQTFTAPLIAEGPGAGCPFQSKDGGPVSGMTFSDEQYEKMWQIKRNAASAGATKMGEVMSASMDVKDLLLQPTLDRGKLKSAHDRLNAAKTELANIKFNERLDLIGVLTDEQRKEFRRNMLKNAACPLGGKMMRRCSYRGRR